MRKLGRIQEKVLDAMRRYGDWNERSCSWVWTTHSETKRILDSLVKRGLVTATAVPIGDSNSRTTNCYALSYRGVVTAKALKEQAA